MPDETVFEETRFDSKTVRRRLRELYRLNKNEMKQGYDVILVGRGRAITAPFSKMQRQYAAALKELGLMEAHR